MCTGPPSGRFGVIRRSLVSRQQQAGSPSPGSVTVGFTLLELMIAIAVILILAAIAIPRIMRMQDSAHDVAIRTELRTLSDELSVYRMDCGGYPEGLDGLNPSSEEGCPRGSAAASAPSTVSGYSLSYTPTQPGENGLYEGYTITADPRRTRANDVQFYLMDQTGIVRMHRGASATASDPAVVP